MTVYHAAIAFSGPVVAASIIQAEFPPNCGWVRYAPNCWIIQTGETAYQIAERLRKVVSVQDGLFVGKFDLNNSYGYLSKEVWEYVNGFSARDPF